MNENIIIDGYNLLKQSPELCELERIDIELARNHLIKMLSAYKRVKSLKIALIFDGWKSGGLSQNSYMERGIKVVFSKLGQTADDVIKNMARDSGKEMVIVTNDLDIKQFVEKTGSVVISSNDFLMKIEMAQYFEIKGIEEEVDYDTKITTKKKGNPKKRPKSERKKNRKLKKL